MKLREESFKCLDCTPEAKELTLYFCPQTGISLLAKKKGYREDFDFFRSQWWIYLNPGTLMIAPEIHATEHHPKKVSFYC